MINRLQFEEAFNKLKKAPRRKEVLENILKGYTSDEIAQLMGIKEGTVRKQVSNIYDKFGIKGQHDTDRHSRIGDLIDLFKKYKPEMVEVQEEFNYTSTPLPEPRLENDSFTNKVDFLGRKEAIKRLNELVNQEEKIIGIYGKGGVGKTKLARQFFKQKGLKCWEIFVGRHPQYITPVEQKISSFLYPNTPYNSEIDFDTLLDCLEKELKNCSLGIIIDNLEPALKKGKLLETHHRYVDLLILLSHPEVKSVTLITSRECLKESKVKVADAFYGLSGLEKTEWQKFFNYYQIKTDSPAFHKLHEAYGGNTKAMEILCGAILRPPFNGSLDAYYRENKEDLLIEGELEDLVSSQFDHLSRTDEDAYNLLYRLGIYSYQNTEFLPPMALNILLWDVPKIRIKRAIKSLENCFMVEIKVEELREGEFYMKVFKYQIHPVILHQAFLKFNFKTQKVNSILLLIKQGINSYIRNDIKIQLMLKTISKKTKLIVTQVDELKEYKIVCLRSFYLSRCTLSCNRLSSISTTIDTSFFAFQGLYHNSQIPQEIKLDNALLSALNSDFSDIVSIIKESDESKDHLLKIIIHEFSVSLYSSLNYYTYNESLKCLLQEILQQIQNHFENITKIKKWWMDKGFNLVQELRAWTIENRGIGHCFDFSEEQEQLLKDYSEANLIFVQCLNSLPNVSPEVREEIEETLLLPIDEIEKWKQQHRPNT